MKNKKIFNTPDEMIKKVSLYANSDYISICFSSVEVIQKFTQGLHKIANGTEKGDYKQYVFDFLRENFENLNQEVYIFVNYLQLKKNLAERKSNHSSERVRYKLLELYLQRLDFSIFVLDEDINKGIEINKKEVSKELGKPSKNIRIGKKEKETKNIMGKLDGYLDMLISLNYRMTDSEIFDYLIMQKIYREHPDYFSIISGRIKSEKYHDKNGKSKFNLESILNDEMKKVFEQTYLDALRRFPEEFNLNGMMMYSAYIVAKALEEEELDNKTKKRYIELLEIINELTGYRNNHVTFDELENDELVESEYTSEDLSELCSRIIDGEYISKKQFQEDREHIETNPETIISINPQEVKLMKFTRNDFFEFAKYEGVLDYLIENSFVYKDFIKELLQKEIIIESDLINLIENNSFNDDIKGYFRSVGIESEKVFEKLEEKGFYTTDEKISLYLDGKIKLGQLNSLNSEKLNELKEKLSITELISFYMDKEKKDEFRKYAEIYKAMILNECEEEQISEFEDEIIEELMKYDIENEDIISLYEHYLLPIEKVEELVGIDFVIEQFKNSRIRPQDALRLNKMSKYRHIIECLDDEEMSLSQKASLLFTTFTADVSLTEIEMEEMQVAMNECIKKLGLKSKSFGNIIIENTGNPVSEIVKERPKKNKTSNQFVSNPFKRWELFSLLDPEYSYEILESGMMIYYMPNLHDGCVILEKMFRKNEIEYGVATRLVEMPISEFKKLKEIDIKRHKDKRELIRDDDIPIDLLKINPNFEERFSSKSHTLNWAQNIADYFEYDVDSRRSKDNIEKIDRVIQEIRDSRVLR